MPRAGQQSADYVECTRPGRRAGKVLAQYGLSLFRFFLNFVVLAHFRCNPDALL